MLDEKDSSIKHTAAEFIIYAHIYKHTLRNAMREFAYTRFI